MMSIAVNVASAVVAAAVALSFVRLWIGPSLPDRVLALDTLYINTIAMLILLGMRLGTDIYFESAMLIAIIGFVGTVAMCKYLLRGDIIE